MTPTQKNTTGRLFGIGLGPGDPELLTLKALRHLQMADIIAYPTAAAGSGLSLGIVSTHLNEQHGLLPLVYPVTAGPEADRADYRARMHKFYDDSAEEIAGCLDLGFDVALVCVGDPFFYGSFTYWYARLAKRFETVVIPGVSAVLAGAVEAGRPLCLQSDMLSIIPGTKSESDITKSLQRSDAAVVMKLGRTFAKVRRAVDAADVLDRAIYVERVTMTGQKIMPAKDVAAHCVPYFSMVIVPGRMPD